MANMEMDDRENALAFAEVLKNTTLSIPVRLGSLSFYGKQAELDTIKYNKREFQMLEETHGYRFEIGDTELQLSIQLYEARRYHYRLFSVNLTKGLQSDGKIRLEQRVRFSEQYEMRDGRRRKLTPDDRQYKVKKMCGKMWDSEFWVDRENRVILGYFNPSVKQFTKPNAVRFLHNFVSMSLLKGHFQGNKGYEIPALP